MQKIFLGSLVCLLLSSGCTSKEVIYTPKIQEVYIPVATKLDRPSRPNYSKSDTVPSYLLKLIEYTCRLEIIIDTNNEVASDK